MVYYSPYKNIIRAFIRAIRIFISSLFSKRLLLMIIVALVVMLLHLNVNAVERDYTIQGDGNYILRNASVATFNSQTNNYDISYHLFNRGGLQEGVVPVPKNWYERSYWALYVDELGDVYYLYKGAGDSFNLYLNLNWYNSAWQELLSFTEGSSSISNVYIKQYDFENNEWLNIYSNYSGNIVKTLYPNDFITYNGCNIYMRSGSVRQTQEISPMVEWVSLFTPYLELHTNNTFRLYLNDMWGNGNNIYEDLTSYYTIRRYLANIYMSVYDLANHTYITQPIDILPNVTVNQDENNCYYIDLPFSLYFNYMNNNDGDYLILFSTDYHSWFHWNTFNIFNPETEYVSIDEFRYIYNTSTGIGQIVPLDYDNTNNNQEPIGDNTENQTATAINELGNTINNQTTIIQEQTNTINDMSNFMQNDNYSSDSITDNMPNADDFQDITENGFDNIFTTLRNTFTSNNYQDVVFTIPFTNGKSITLPSNLTENIIPTAIKTLIQMVYWYFISRFIVKDIAGYIEKAKSGDIFNSSDTNIKTDML